MKQRYIKARNPLKASFFKRHAESIDTPGNTAMMVPAANVDETTNEYMLTIASPGFQRENLRVMIENNILTVSAAKEKQITHLI